MRTTHKYVNPDNPNAMKLDLKKVQWTVCQKQEGEITNAQMAKSMNISLRWVQKLWARYRHENAKNTLHPKKIVRTENGMHERRKHSAVLSAWAQEQLGSVSPQHIIKAQAGMHVPNVTIRHILRCEKMTQRQPKKSRKRKWVRHEREHSNSMWHAEWKQIHTGMHVDRWFPCHEDDASRFVTGYGISDNATAENALHVLGQAIKDHGKPASIMTSHGSQFYANERVCKTR